MITVHHLNNSRSQRVLWLLEELDLEYEIKFYQRDPDTMLAPQSLREVHPLGKSPVITDGDLTIAESGAIIEYLVERYGAGKFIPAAGTPERLRYRYWLHYAEGSAMPLLVMKLIFSRIPASVPALIRPLARRICNGVLERMVNPQLTRHLHYLESELGRSNWFAGETFSAADIQMSFPLEAANARGGLDSQYPHLLRFLASIHARPAYVRALKRGGLYALLR